MKRAQQKKTVQSTVYEGASFNFFKKEMIMELVADELEAEGVMGEDRPERKKEQTKKKGGKGRVREDKDAKNEPTAPKADPQTNGVVKNGETKEVGKSTDKIEDEGMNGHMVQDENAGGKMNE